MWNHIRNFFISKPKPLLNIPNMKEHLSAEPDLPESFGYKTAWLAIPEKLEKFFDVFNYSEIQPANWKTGLDFVNKNSDFVFITPEVKGWTFIVGLGLLKKTEPIGAQRDMKDILSFFETIGIKTKNFFYFHTYRVSEAHAWVKFQDGVLKRVLYFSDGEISYEWGDISDEEKALDIYQKEEDYFDIDEDHVIALASIWSLNPLELENLKEAPGIGYVCKIP